MGVGNSTVYNAVDTAHIAVPHQTQGESPAATEALNFSSPASLPTSFHSAPYNTVPTESAGYSTKDQTNLGQVICSLDQISPRANGIEARRPPARSPGEAPTAFDHIQESCLLRYFIEELSAWVG
jgi:hypothetical protein